MHGLGRYDSSQWTPGAIFCDEVRVPITGSLRPARVYDMTLAIMNWRTLAVDWQATDPGGKALGLPVIGQVASPIGDELTATAFKGQSVDITFQGLAALQAFSLDKLPAPGESIQVSLLWKVTGQTRTSWSQFFHLIGPNTALVLADGVPRTGNYPTWAWSSGEKIVDTWTLAIPKTLPPGEYTIDLGFYRQDIGDRVSVIQNSESSPERTALLLKFQVR
jgi:hypothetical protein